jgi:hypothetical protein
MRDHLFTSYRPSALLLRQMVEGLVAVKDQLLVKPREGDLWRIKVAI